MKKILIIVIIIIFCSCSNRHVSMQSQTAHIYGKRAYERFNNCDFHNALVNYHKAFANAGISDEPLLQAQYLFNIGRVFFEMELFDSAEQYFSACIHEYHYYQDSVAEAASIAWKTMCLAILGKNDSVKNMTENFTFLRNRLNLNFWYNINARIEMALGNLTRASIFLDSSLNVLQKKRNYESLALNCFYRGQVAAFQGDYNRALVLLDSALIVSEVTDIKYRRWRMHLEIAKINYCLGNNSIGERYYYRALQCIVSGVKFPEIDSVAYCNY